MLALPNNLRGCTQLTNSRIVLFKKRRIKNRDLLFHRGAQHCLLAIYIIYSSQVTTHNQSHDNTAHLFSWYPLCLLPPLITRQPGEAPRPFDCRQHKRAKQKPSTIYLSWPMQQQQQQERLQMLTWMAMAVALQTQSSVKSLLY